MRRLVLNKRGINKCAVVLMITLAGTLGPLQALRKTIMPAQFQTKHAEPQARTMQLKLPLFQPVFHWTFLSKKDLLAGKLVLRISRPGKVETITIFKEGKLSEGWEAITIPHPKAGEIYFGFQSTNTYLTAPGDRLELELEVTRDLDGIGPMDTGVLPAGNYMAHGIYSGLIDEYQPPAELKNMPEEGLAKLHQMMNFRAFMENWEVEWPMRMTSDQGWLTAQERERFQAGLEAMAKEDAKKKEEEELR